MSVEAFISELKQRQLIPDRLESKLREKLAAADRPLSARAVAKFLVQKKHLSQRHAAQALDAIMARGEDVDAIFANNPLVPEAVDLAPPPSAKPAEAADVKKKSRKVPPAPTTTTDDEDDNPESSSVFAPFLASNRKKNEAPPNDQPEGADEVELLPDEPLVPATPLEPSQLTSVDDLSELNASKSSLDVHEELMSDPLTAEVNLTARKSALRPASSIKLKGTGRPERAAREAARRSAARARRGNKAKSLKKAKQKNEWDSPLILVGGGALIVLVLGGLAVWWLLSTETGDDKLRTAQEARDSGSYGNAIERYEKFLADHPSHAKASSARIELAMTRIRSHANAGRYSVALQTAQEEIEAIEDEEAFLESQPDLAGLLPTIAEGLAAEAEKASEPQESQRFVDQATKALELCGVTKYIPKRFRDETQLDEVRQVLARVERRQKSRLELQNAVAEIEASISSGDTRAAYATHRQIIKRYPDLAGNETLAELVRTTSAAEQSAIRYVAEEQASESTDHPTPWIAALAIAHRHPGKVATAHAPGSLGAACVRIDGALYGIDVATGRLLWRRHVGYAMSGWPVMDGNSVLIADTNRNELLRLEATSGKLLWRQAVGEPFAPPAVVGNRAFLAADSGRLYVVDVASGARMGYMQFGQPLSVPPMADRQGEHLYLAGDEYNLYAISLSDLECLGVYYLGHPKGSIQFSPAPVLDKLAVIVSDGIETSRFHLLLLDDKGAIVGEKTSERLHGLAAAPPLVSGRRLVVATDRGQMQAYDIATGDDDTAITLVATREATDRRPVTRHMLVADNNIWVGDTQLTKFGISPAGNRLPVQSIDNSFTKSVFDHPLEIFGNVLVHVHRVDGRAGAVVAAMNTDEGRTLWQTELAMPPAGSPIVDEAARAVTAATASGYVYRFDENAIKARVQDEPLAASEMPAKPPLITESIDLGSGRAAFCHPGESNQIILYDPTENNRQVHWISLPSRLACNISPFADGLLAPLSVGQIFYIWPSDGSSGAAPFQPRLQPRTTVDYKPAGAIDVDGEQFVITDGRDKIYRVVLADPTRPNLATAAEAGVGPFPIESATFVINDTVLAVTEESNIVRFRLPSLEATGETDLPGDVAWGPFVVGDRLILATSGEQLIAVNAGGEIVWSVPLAGGDLAGSPLLMDGALLVAYQRGTVERRSPEDGSLLGELDIEHPLAAGPVRFLNHALLTASDGTLLVIEAP